MPSLNFQQSVIDPLVNEYNLNRVAVWNSNSSSSNAAQFTASLNTSLTTINPSLSATPISVANQSALSTYLLDNHDILAAAQLTNNNSLAVLHNATLINTLPPLLAQCQAAVHNVGQRVSVSSHPLLNPSLTFDGGSFSGIILLSLAFCFGVAGFAIDIVSFFFFFFFFFSIIKFFYFFSIYLLFLKLSIRFVIDSEKRKIC